ncbi:Hypothetical protein ETEE_1707 [Edwardsiella anguillarum ET080813]|uniref:Uncharacterized protein n=1 Tax=Edwardsiella anguillarum ET080813 TaxID=667120 RepID=A0A076LJM0_9GAMM|nr:Hypothetical protein ETEE_1707 [Edwardsiella anguillarum ET080813]
MEGSCHATSLLESLIDFIVTHFFERLFKKVIEQSFKNI